MVAALALVAPLVVASEARHQLLARTIGDYVEELVGPSAPKRRSDPAMVGDDHVAALLL